MLGVIVLMSFVVWELNCHRGRKKCLLKGFQRPSDSGVSDSFISFILIPESEHRDQHYIVVNGPKLEVTVIASYELVAQM